MNEPIASQQISVVIVDDHPVVREGITAILSTMESISVVGVAGDGADAVAVVERESPDVVLMDLQMPGVSGIEAIGRLRRSHPDTRVVALTTYTDDETVLDAFSAGAIGYLTKNASVEDIRRALEAAAAGQSVMERSVHARLVDQARGERADATAPDAVRPTPDGLSAREAEVLGLIGRGLSNAEIAEQLFISRTTVKAHINQILRKTGCRDRSRAIVYALRNDIA